MQQTPGRRASHGDNPLNSCSDIRERNRISPIQMNSGSAASDHALLEPQTVVAITSPIGAELKSAMPSMPTARSENATHTPLASTARRKTTSSAA